MYLLAIKLPILRHKKMTVNLKKIATNTSFDTSYFVSFTYFFLFGEKSINLLGGQEQTKCFNRRALPVMFPSFVADQITRRMTK